MRIDTCQHTYPKHPTIITLSIVCAGKLLEALGHFLHTSLQLSQFHEVLISIFHGVSIHCEKLRRSMHFSEIQMVVENYG